MTRREIMAAGLSALVASGRSRAEDRPPGSLGLVIHSFPVRLARDREKKPEDRLSDPIRFLEYGHSIGAAGIQVGIGARDDAYADRLRGLAEAASMDLEGIVSPPRDEGDVARFEAEIRTARRAGAEIVRTVLSSGRRYEVFDSLDGFRRSADRASHSLSLAAPIVVKHGVRLAVENHKDFRSDELVTLLKKLNCDHIGTCVDTGNSLALLEDPIETVETLAPWPSRPTSRTWASRNMRKGSGSARSRSARGFSTCHGSSRSSAGHPDIHFNLEMITRDPLDIPCLTDRYWSTFPDLSGRHLARRSRTSGASARTPLAAREPVPDRRANPGRGRQYPSMPRLCPRTPVSRGIAGRRAHASECSRTWVGIDLEKAVVHRNDRIAGHQRIEARQAIVKRSRNGQPTQAGRS